MTAPKKFQMEIFYRGEKTLSRFKK
jgi:hypothetical protein